MKKHAIVAESTRPSHRPARADENAGPRPLLGAAFETGVAAWEQLPPPGPPEIAFAGRSNAGKSSAINALARRNRLAFASRTPGRTREINFFALKSGARIADLPGYGYAAVSRDIKRGWQDLLVRYVAERPSLVGLVLIADSRHGLAALDLELLTGFMSSARPVIVLATKSDKLNVAEQRRAAQGIRTQLGEAFGPAVRDATPVILFSAVAGTGVAEADAALQAWMPAAG